MTRRTCTFALAALLGGCFGGFPRGLPPDAAPPEDASTDGRPDDRGPPDMMPDVRAPDMAPPPPETCNGLDDDLDGDVDEAFPDVGEACRTGLGACEADGVRQCNADGDATECVVDTRPEAETCNGIDDDCDGSTDEAFPELGAPCSVGRGICARASTVACTDDASATHCPTTDAPGDNVPEMCNDLDDDCDGSVDEGLERSCDVDGAFGPCAVGVETCAAGEWGACVGPEPGMETCNGVDDDCDRRVDEDFGLGAVCELPDDIVPDCEVPHGQLACSAAGLPACLAPPESICDGLDDNCDGVVDDGAVCADIMAASCGFWLAWSTRPEPSPSPDWGGCVEDRIGDDYSCNGTSAPDGFVSISLPVDIDAEGADRLATAVRCDPDGGEGAVYLARHCRLYLGLALEGAAPDDGAERWGACPAEPVGGDDTITCTSSGDDGAFLPMPVPFDVTRGTALGVAFRCEDPDDGPRAAAATAALEVVVAWAASGGAGLADEDWAQICRAPGDGRPDTACVSTGGDGLFHRLDFTSDVGPGHTLAIMVRPR